jgi:signal transduction histidine kinase
MRLTPNISQKGLILVAVPLLSGLIFLAVLFALLRQAEAEILQQVQVKLVLFQAATLSRLFDDANIAARGYYLSKDQIFGKPYDSVVNRIRKQFASMDRLSIEEPATAATLKAMRADAEPGLAALTRTRQQIDAGGDVDIPRLTAELNSTSKKLTAELNRLSWEDKKLEEEGADPAQQSRLMIQSLLGVGVLLNIALSVFLAEYFSRNITSRLKVLSENAERFAQNEKLHAPISGNDEIAHLDKVFHDMTGAITEANQRKQEFLSIVSHDLKTPLTSIQMFLGMLGEGFYGDLNAKGQQNVESCDRSVSRLLSLIRDLLDIEKMAAGKFELDVQPVDVSSVIDRAVEDVQHFAREHNVAIVVSGGSSQALGDKDRLVQVLVNLLSNAIKFSNNGERVSINTAEKDQFVEISVSDTGRGIPPELKDAVFERFKQVDISDSRDKGGTGLGLPICKALIEQHNGTIGVHSELGKGSTFWFRIPAMKSAVSAMG